MVQAKIGVSRPDYSDFDSKPFKDIKSAKKLLLVRKSCFSLWLPDYIYSSPLRKMASKTFICGVGMTKFSRPFNRDWDYPDIGAEAGSLMLKKLSKPRAPRRPIMCVLILLYLHTYGT